MKNLQIHITVSEDLYLKNPESSVLGKKIVSKSIELIDQLGFEAFTFKKLGIAIGSPESSVYRYFDSKRSLLVYLYAWYWSWMEYRLVFGTINHTSAKEKLKSAITLLCSPIETDQTFEHIDEVILNRIIVAESIKVSHNKTVDEQNQKGLFNPFKQVIERVSAFISQINPDYPYPNMLVFAMVDGAIEQSHFASHFPKTTDEINSKTIIADFYTDLIFKAIQ
ncbi:TetR/AcrR family transcriptional regulator [Putridiphycobacter roseus]|uniref:TetR/AcrR family transcriptional regulator n=1 Tax=Putridiphycobacter roseus TaxID=2219161 RepID=A0A2W1N4S1_9FLAO|nr:TetR/AcrR family transcriptional regulator [Putridiphycobacter roseus]PZE18081.1 TetR/AcrR family transcriptional regulator [Putridiphycobacter roseus]